MLLTTSASASASVNPPCQVAIILGPQPWQIRNPRRRLSSAGRPPLQISQKFQKKINKFQSLVYTQNTKEMVYTSTKNLENRGVYLQNSKIDKSPRGVYPPNCETLARFWYTPRAEFEKRRISKNSTILQLAF